VKRSTDHLSNSDYEFIFKRTPRICLDFVIEHNQELLMTKRTNPPYKGTWNFPGGRLRFKESVEDATARILGTELGLKNFQCAARLIGFCEFLRESRNLHSFSLVFLLKLSDEEVAQIQIDKQASAHRFFNDCPRHMHPVHQRFALKHHLFNAS
jgi:ADP-ribose pyrophosphatase YjhB (NUDIX family)